MKLLRQSMAVFLSWSLVLVGVGDGFADQTNASAPPPPPQAAPQSAQQLQQLVARVALYPDPLIAHILAASAFPDQVVEAGRWMQQNKNLQGDQLAQEV